MAEGIGLISCHPHKVTTEWQFTQPFAEGTGRVVPSCDTNNPLNVLVAFLAVL